MNRLGVGSDRTLPHPRLPAVAQRFIGSAADPTSVAVANIRAANDKGGAVLEWLPEATGPPSLTSSCLPLPHHISQEALPSLPHSSIPTGPKLGVRKQPKS